MTSDTADSIHPTLAALAEYDGQRRFPGGCDDCHDDTRPTLARKNRPGGDLT